MTPGTIFVYFLFLLAGIIMILAGMQMRSKAERSRRWPTTAGRILSLGIDDSMDPDGSTITYQTNVEYAYSVRGVDYESSRIAFGYSAGPSRQAQVQLCARLKQSPELTVYYNPARPSESVLDTSTTSSASGLVSAGMIWLVLTIGFIILDALS